MIKKFFKKVLSKLIQGDFKNFNQNSLQQATQLNFDSSGMTEDSFYSNYGYAKSTKTLNREQLQKIFLHFQYQEKAKVALSVVSSYWGGDYLEFGAHDMYTFRNFLSSFHTSNLIKNFPDTNFYAFDIFGSIENNDFFANLKDSKKYFDDFMKEGDVLKKYENFLDEFGLFRDKCFLIKGLFEESLKKFEYKRKIGFVCLDCNILDSYKTVLKWLEHRINHGMYIYIDEYFDNGHYTDQNGIYFLFQDFIHKSKINGYDITFIRSAAGVGALFRVFKKF